MSYNPFPVEEPHTVFHYTSVDTMMKIVSSRTLWATNISYLNDTSEGDHFIRMVQDRLPHLMPQRELQESPLVQEFGARGRSIETRPFITSFSADGDSLPQWRSYCPSGNGVAIGFSVKSLKEARVEPQNDKIPQSFKPSVEFARVQYMPEDKTPPSLDNLLWRLINDARTSPLDKFGMPDFTQELNLSDAVEREACRRKHSSFRAENEYRLIVVRPFLTNIEFRSVRSTLVPYIKLSIPEFKEQDGGGRARLDLVTKVVVGPTTDARLSISAIEGFFNKLNLGVDVVSSQCPFRDW